MAAAYLGRSTAAPRVPVEVQPQHLQAAFTRLRKPRWPATLEEALADRTCAPLLQGLARELARQAARRPTHAVAAPAGVPARHHAAPAPRAPLGGFDPKRAAANDRDDE